jgi:maleylacetoacetate isomerase
MENYQKTELTLYTYFRSSTTWRVRILLHHKKLAVNYKFIHLAKGEQMSEEFGKVNPNHGVPALVLPTGETLIESMAICEYLEEIYPENSLLPKDAIKKAQVRGFCEVVNSGMHPYQNLRLLEKVGNDQASRIKFGAEWVQRGMKTFEAMLEKTKGKYCFGDEVTLADAFFYPQVLGGIARFGVNIDDFPLCKEVLKNLQ